MSVLSARWERKVLYAWLWRSQPNSPLKDLTKAEKIYNRYTVTIEAEIARLGLTETITYPEPVQELTETGT